MVGMGNRKRLYEFGDILESEAIVGYFIRKTK